MQTAHDILVEDRMARVQREWRERMWADLVSRCRAPRWQAPFWYQSAVFAAFLGYILFKSQPVGSRAVAALAAIYLAVCVPAYVRWRRAREKALLAIVELEAPDLFRKLQPVLRAPLGSDLPEASATRMRRLRIARTIVGVAVIVANLAVVGTGILALKDHEDVSAAMKWPFVVAVLLCWAFAHIAGRISELRSTSAW